MVAARPGRFGASGGLGFRRLQRLGEVGPIFAPRPLLPRESRRRGQPIWLSNERSGKYECNQNCDKNTEHPRQYDRLVVSKMLWRIRKCPNHKAKIGRRILHRPNLKHSRKLCVEGCSTDFFPLFRKGLFQVGRQAPNCTVAKRTYHELEYCQPRLIVHQTFAPPLLLGQLTAKALASTIVATVFHHRPSAQRSIWHPAPTPPRRAPPASRPRARW